MVGMIYLLVGCLLYAIFNLIIQHKLSGVNGLSKAALVGVSNVGLTWLLFAATQKTEKICQLELWKWGLLAGVVVCLANVAYFQSYSYGVTAVTGTTMFVTVPIFAALIMFILEREAPSMWDYFSFLFAALAVTCRGIAMQQASPSG